MATLSEPYLQTDGRHEELVAVARLAEKLTGDFPHVSAWMIVRMVQSRYDDCEFVPDRDIVPAWIEESVRSVLVTVPPADDPLRSARNSRNP
jgi:hypothetical protein